MAKINFAELSPEEVQALTGKDLDAYNAYVLKQAEKDAPKKDADKDAPVAPAAAGKAAAKKELSPKQLGKQYFKDHPDCPFDTVVVSNDGVVYPGTPQGKNAAENYRNDKKKAGIEIELGEVSKD